MPQECRLFSLNIRILLYPSTTSSHKRTIQHEARYHFLSPPSAGCRPPSLQLYTTKEPRGLHRHGRSLCFSHPLPPSQRCRPILLARRKDLKLLPSPLRLPTRKHHRPRRQRCCPGTSPKQTKPKQTQTNPPKLTNNRALSSPAANKSTSPPLVP